MKHIKSFESSTSYKEMMDNLKDILLEIEDEGLKCQINSTDYIQIGIFLKSWYDMSFFRYSKIYDAIERVKYFMSEYGYNFSMNLVYKDISKETNFLIREKDKRVRSLNTDNPSEVPKNSAVTRVVIVLSKSRKIYKKPSRYSK